MKCFIPVLPYFPLNLSGTDCFHKSISSAWKNAIKYALIKFFSPKYKEESDLHQEEAQAEHRNAV